MPLASMPRPSSRSHTGKSWTIRFRNCQPDRGKVTVQTWLGKLAEGGLPKAGTGGGGYVIYRAWILKLTSPPSTVMC